MNVIRRFLSVILDDGKRLAGGILIGLLTMAGAFAQYQPPSIYSIEPPPGEPIDSNQALPPAQPLPRQSSPPQTRSPQAQPPASVYPQPGSTQSGPIQTEGIPMNPYPQPQVYGAPQVNDPTLGQPGFLSPALTPPPPPVVYPNERVADLIVEGSPARTGRVIFGGAVNSDAGVTGQVTIDERNFDITRWPRSFQDLFGGTAFKGAGQTFRLEAMPGNLFQRYTVSFSDPNLLGYLPISMSVSGFYFDRRFNDWDEGRLGGRLNFGYRITPDLSVSAGVTGQNVEIRNTSVGVGAVPELDAVRGDNALYTGLVSLIHDTRNSPLQPSEGHFFRSSYEQAFGDYDYGRFEGEYRKYFLLSERADGSGKQTLQLSSRIGISGEETPLFENFFAGGYATMRGFDFRGANPIVATGFNNVEVGGRFQFLNTVEYMFPITADDAFRGVAFVDFGTVERDIEINSENFRVAPGVGVRIAIPMLGPAPLAFDFAFPVAKAELDDERVFTFYMSAVR